jgi:hypothetical protein
MRSTFSAAALGALGVMALSAAPARAYETIEYTASMRSGRSESCSMPAGNVVARHDYEPFGLR